MWVYDKVYDSAKCEYVALMYHVEPDGWELHPDCLALLRKELDAEGLTVLCSPMFTTLAEAKRHAWTLKDLFAKDLD